MADYHKLQNGSDVRGVALEGMEPVTLTSAIAQEIARAFVCWLASKYSKDPQGITIGVGWDSRLSGPQLASGVTAGLSQEGATCFTCGLSSTPAMFMSTILPGFGWDGAIMITASHLPWNRNGLKFFTPAGGLDKEDIAAILSLAASLSPASLAPQPSTPCPQLMDAYAAHLRAVIAGGLDAAQDTLPLAGYKIAVDCGGGSGGFFAHKVLAPLGADISASRFLEPDGYFKGHIPNPENQEAMASIREAVQVDHCHLGIIFDTDVDRVGAVLANGQELCRNRFIAIIVSIIASEAPGSTIVTDNVTSSQLTDFIENTLGCIHHRFKRGYKNIINEAKRLNQIGCNCLLAMETSGHSALRENYFLDDGAYLAAKLIVQMVRLGAQGKTLEDLLSGLGEPLEAQEYRIPLMGENPSDQGNGVLAGLQSFAANHPDWQVETNNCDGLRCAVPRYQGWFLLRLSLHDPLMPLNIESNCPGGVKAILAQVMEYLGTCPQLDTRPLKQEPPAPKSKKHPC